MKNANHMPEAQRAMTLSLDVFHFRTAQNYRLCCYDTRDFPRSFSSPTQMQTFREHDSDYKIQISSISLNAYIHLMIYLKYITFLRLFFLIYIKFIFLLVTIAQFEYFIDPPSMNINVYAKYVIIINNVNQDFFLDVFCKKIIQLSLKFYLCNG